ncbi:MAG: hypothetical protein ACERK0_04285, partial [Deltaproteobacteria bacterium]
RWSEVLAPARMRGISHEPVGAAGPGTGFASVGCGGRHRELGEHLFNEATLALVTDSIRPTLGI